MSVLDTCPECGSQPYSIFAGAWSHGMETFRAALVKLPGKWTPALVMTEEGVLSWAAVAPGHFVVRNGQPAVLEEVRKIVASRA